MRYIELLCCSLLFGSISCAVVVRGRLREATKAFGSSHSRRIVPSSTWKSHSKSISPLAEIDRFLKYRQDRAAKSFSVWNFWSKEHTLDGITGLSIGAKEVNVRLLAAVEGLGKLEQVAGNLDKQVRSGSEILQTSLQEIYFASELAEGSKGAPEFTGLGPLSQGKGPQIEALKSSLRDFERAMLEGVFASLDNHRGDTQALLQNLREAGRQDLGAELEGLLQRERASLEEQELQFKKAVEVALEAVESKQASGREEMTVEALNAILKPVFDFNLDPISQVEKVLVRELEALADKVSEEARAAEVDAQRLSSRECGPGDSRCLRYRSFSDYLKAKKEVDRERFFSFFFSKEPITLSRKEIDSLLEDAEKTRLDLNSAFDDLSSLTKASSLVEPNLHMIILVFRQWLSKSNKAGSSFMIDNMETGLRSFEESLSQSVFSPAEDQQAALKALASKMKAADLEALADETQLLIRDTNQERERNKKKFGEAIDASLSRFKELSSSKWSSLTPQKVEESLKPLLEFDFKEIKTLNSRLQRELDKIAVSLDQEIGVFGRKMEDLAALNTKQVAQSCRIVKGKARRRVKDLKLKGVPKVTENGQAFIEEGEGAQKVQKELEKAANSEALAQMIEKEVAYLREARSETIFSSKEEEKAAKLAFNKGIESLKKIKSQIQPEEKSLVIYNAEQAKRDAENLYSHFSGCSLSLLAEPPSPPLSTWLEALRKSGEVLISALMNDRFPEVARVAFARATLQFYKEYRVQVRHLEQSSSRFNTLAHQRLSGFVEGMEKFEEVAYRADSSSLLPPEIAGIALEELKMQTGDSWSELDESRKIGMERGVHLSWLAHEAPIEMTKGILDGRETVVATKQTTKLLGSAEEQGRRFYTQGNLAALGLTLGVAAGTAWAMGSLPEMNGKGKFTLGETWDDLAVL